MPTELTKTDGEMLAELGTDGTQWAAEFARVVYARSHQMTRWDRDQAAEHGIDHRLTQAEAIEYLVLGAEPGNLLHVWFANAIEAGRAAGWAAATEPAEPLKAPTDLPADPAGSDALPADVAATQPADVAGRDLPADPAGRWLPADYDDMPGAQRRDVLERLVQATERQAAALEAIRAIYAQTIGRTTGSAPPAAARVEYGPPAPWQAGEENDPVLPWPKGMPR